MIHFYPKISVEYWSRDPLEVGEKNDIGGKTTHLEQVVESMQAEHDELKSVKPG